MRGKQLVKTIFIILVVCWALYALWPSYRFYTIDTEKRGALEEEGRLVSLRKKTVKMGLDLQGGMYLVYEVDLPSLVEQLARNRDDQLDAVLQEIREELSVSTEDFLTILNRTFRDKEIPLNRYWGDRGDGDNRVLNELRNEAEASMERSLQKLRNRIDQFGVSEPNISPLGNRRILIELPGVSDPDQAKELIGRTALLEFKLVKEPADLTDTIQRIDRALAEERGIPAEEPTQAEEDTTAAEVQRESQDKVISVSELFGEERVTPSSDTDEDTTLVVDEQMFQENPFIALLRGRRGRSDIVSVPIENVKAVDRILARENIQALLPPDSEILWGSESYNIADQEYRDLYLLKKDTELTGRYLTDARVAIGSDAANAGRPQVNFTLNRSGARIISRVSAANINKFLAIVLDGRVMTAPRIQSKLGASSRITGIEDMDEAKMISIVLRVGALDAPISIVEERTVGPSLGRDSVTRGGYSAMIGMALIVLFMILYYRLAGMIADIALLLNLIILVAILAQFGFTLTLPGVAGIVLTIGMAVDANVLVFERIREELKTGKTVRASIDAGYSRAFRTILDANITTLLTALVLYQFGTGPIRGFAVTLSIGIVVSMFTALVVTRAIFNSITSRRTLTRLSI